MENYGGDEEDKKKVKISKSKMGECCIKIRTSSVS